MTVAGRLNREASRQDRRSRDIAAEDTCLARVF
jgi:hypothetical protein